MFEEGLALTEFRGFAKRLTGCTHRMKQLFQLHLGKRKLKPMIPRLENMILVLHSVSEKLDKARQ